MRAKQRGGNNKKNHHVIELVSRGQRTGIPEIDHPNVHGNWDYNEYDKYHTHSIRLGEDVEATVHFKRNSDTAQFDESTAHIIRTLHFLDAMTRQAQTYCKQHLNECPNSSLFASTKHVFYELPTSLAFNGVNKPKNVHDCALANGVNIGKDGTLRSHERYVMVEVASKSPRDLKALFVHEIAHTFCNHVLFRHDDHGEDFQNFERHFLQILDKLGYDRQYRDQVLRHAAPLSRL
jgi:hypothetical protein